MRMRWLILAAVLSAGVFAGAWCLPPAPLWRAKVLSRAEIFGFSSDGRTLYVVEDLQPSPIVGRWWPERPAPRILCFNAATGQVQQAWDIPFPDVDRSDVKMWLSPDRSTLVLGGAEKNATGKTPKSNNSYFLYDVLTGVRRCGPIKDAESISRRAFSPDSRWLTVDRLGERTIPDSFDVIEVATGKCILRIPDRNHGELTSRCFSRDGSALAVHWNAWGGDNADRHSVQIFDLPGGKKTRRLELPRLAGFRLFRLDADRLFARVHLMDDGRAYSFDITADAVGLGRREPWLDSFEHFDARRIFREGYRDEGPGWVAQLAGTLHEETGIDKAIGWLGKKLGKDFGPSQGWIYRVRLLDTATGELRSELPTQLDPGFSTSKLELCISPDGTRVAILHPKRGVEVRDTNSLRWPLPVTAALITSGSVLVLGRWRKRRSNPTGVNYSHSAPSFEGSQGVGRDTQQAE